MDNSEGRFEPVRELDFTGISSDPVKKKKLFRQGEIVKIKESYFVVRNIDFSGIMTLKLLPNNEETALKYSLQKE